MPIMAHGISSVMSTCSIGTSEILAGRGRILRHLAAMVNHHDSAAK